MTPAEVITAARNKYNSVSDTFFSDSELYHLVYEAEMQIAMECLAIERTFQTTTVSGTQEYDIPELAISIKRVQYDGKRLTRITESEDDVLTFNDQDTTTTGVPAYYQVWHESISLRPIPNDALTLKMWCYCEPDEVSATSVLDVPTFCHPRLVNFVVSEMALKDENTGIAQAYLAKWEQDKMDIKKWAQKKKTGDGYGHVQNEDMINDAIWGR